MISQLVNVPRYSVIVKALFCILLAVLLSGLIDQPGLSQALNDVTPSIERIGNPFSARFPTPDLYYARNVWDMEVYDDRLYLGHGNSNNDGPAPNAGPVEIWSYNGQTFTTEYTVNDEQINQFLILGSDLYVPGHDTTLPTHRGNFYHLVNGQWQERNNILQAAHVYDMELYSDRLFAVTAATTPDATIGTAIGVSDDQGETWTGQYLIAELSDAGNLYEPVAWDLVKVNDDLLVSSQPLILLVQAEDGTVQRQTYGGMLHRYEVGAFMPLSLDGFPGRSLDIQKERSLRMARTVPFGDGTVYVGATVQGTGHQWTSFGLFYIQKTGSSYSVTKLATDTVGDYIWDTLVDNNVLYILGSTCGPANASPSHCTVSVTSTCDLNSWYEVLRFDAETFARSFALYRGDFYFGMGTDTNFLSAEAGEIFRVSRANFSAGCQA